MSDSDPTRPVFTQAEAEVARWVLSDSEWPENLDPHLEALVRTTFLIRAAVKRSRHSDGLSPREAAEIAGRWPFNDD